MARPHGSGLASVTVAALAAVSAGQVQTTELGEARFWEDDCTDPEKYWLYDDAALLAAGQVQNLGIECMNGVFDEDFTSIQRSFNTTTFFDEIQMNVRVWFLCNIDPAERFQVWVYGRENSNRIYNANRDDRESCDGWESIPYNESSWQGADGCLIETSYNNLSCFRDLSFNIKPQDYDQTWEDDIILRFGVNNQLDGNEGWAISGLNFSLFGTASPTTSPTKAPTETRVDCKEFEMYLTDESLTLYEMMEEITSFRSTMVDVVYDELILKVADYGDEQSIRDKSELEITGAREYGSVNTTVWMFELCVTSDLPLFDNFTAVINDEGDLESVAQGSVESLQNVTASMNLEFVSDTELIEEATRLGCDDDSKDDDDGDDDGFTWYFWVALGFLVAAAVVALCHFFIWKQAMSKIHTIEVPPEAYASMPSGSVSRRAGGSVASAAASAADENGRSGHSSISHRPSDGPSSMANTGAKSNDDQADVKRALMMQHTQVEAASEDSFAGPLGPGSMRDLGPAGPLQSDDTEAVGEGEFLPPAPVALEPDPGMTQGNGNDDYRHSSLYEVGAGGGLGPGLAGGIAPGLLATPGGGGYDDYNAY